MVSSEIAVPPLKARTKAPNQNHGCYFLRTCQYGIRKSRQDPFPCLHDSLSEALSPMQSLIGNWFTVLSDIRVMNSFRSKLMEH